MLSGNPFVVAVGQAMLELLDDASLYERLEQTSTQLAKGLLALCQQANIPAVVNQVGSMFTLFFTGEPVRNYDDAKRADTGRFARFFHGMLNRGIYLPPSQFEAAFVSAAHTDEDIAATLAAAAAVLATL